MTSAWKTACYSEHGGNRVGPLDRADDCTGRVEEATQREHPHAGDADRGREGIGWIPAALNPRATRVASSATRGT